MQTYITLLRGINVGGNNKISMPLLKSAFEEYGYTQVKTYINSGNIIFDSETTSTTELIRQCEKIIKDKFNLVIPVCVMSASEFSKILSHAPEWWDVSSDEEIIHQAITLIPPMTAEEVYQAVGKIKDDIEKVGHYRNVIFWSALKSSYSRTNWRKIASTDVYRNVTIRTANTVKKLISLSGINERNCDC